jgi:Ferric reductase like transmembrane component
MATTLTAAVGTNSRALWYLTRGFGLIALVLLTATLVMGLTQVVRYARPGLPRFVISALHKNISILAVVFLAVHVLTAVADTYAPISIASVFIPFTGKYRPIWLGLGALALDLLLALVITSLLRDRIGHRAWRSLHWAAYLCWPVAILHGLGTGSDAKLRWVLVINAICVAAGLAAIWWRLAQGWAPANTGRRSLALLGTFVLPLLVGVWTVTGPLKPGWAKRAGTPTALLRANSAALSPSPTSPSGSSGPTASGSTALKLPYSSSFAGTQSERRAGEEGLVSVILRGSFAKGSFQIVLNGQPLDGGGVQLTGSQVTFGPTSSPSQYSGQVTELSGNTIIADVSDSSGRTVTVTVRLATNQGQSIGGTIEAT